MDFVSLLLIFAGIFNIVWVVLFLRSYFSGINRKIANFFIFNVVTVFAWILAMFFYRYNQDDAMILLLCRFLYVSAAAIPVTLLYFAYFFSEKAKKHSRLVLILISLPPVFLAYLILFTNTIIFSAYKVSGQEHYIVWGSLYFLYVTYIPIYFLWSFVILAKHYRENSGFIRLQSLYILIGASISSFIGMITNLILPSFYYFRFNWLGQVATIIWVSSTIYPIARHRLSDIRIVFKKVFIYILSAAFTYGSFYLLIWFYDKSLGGVFSSSSYTIGLFVAPVFVVIFLWFYNALKNFTDRLLFFSLYSHQKTIAKLTDELTDSIDLNKIIDSIVNSIKQSMQLNRAGVLLIDQSGEVIKYKIAKTIGFNENNGISLVQDNFLTRYLEKTQKPLVRDEIQMISKDSVNSEEKRKFNAFFDNMIRIEASLCLPMTISGGLIGIIVLGSKISGDAYTKEDLELLNTLSKQAAVAIDNARLYKEVQDFNKNLQQKVDEQTQKIKQSYEAEKKYRERIDAIRVEDEALLANIGDGVIAVDKEGKVTFINRAAEDMLMIKTEDVINKPYNEVFVVQNEKGEPIPKEKNRFFSALASGKKTAVDMSGSADSIYYYVRGDKTRFPAAETVAPVLLLGNIIGAVDVFRDITVEREIDKSKSEFVSLASHQLRTPLSAIKWYVEALLKPKMGKVSPKQKKFLNEIHDGNERIISLVNVLLNISRLEAGKLQTTIVDIDFKKTVQEVIKSCSRDAKLRKQKIIFEYNSDISHVKTDIDLARTVIQNLVANAVKYTPEKGKIICAVETGSDGVLLKVSDTGIGIPKEQQSKIFEKLFRGSNAFSHDPQGNGLGLYAAKKITEAIGGKIWFESKEGKGSTFYLSLPTK